MKVLAISNGSMTAWIPMGGVPDILFEHQWRIIRIVDVDPGEFQKDYEKFSHWVSINYNSEPQDRYINNRRPSNVFPVY